MVPLYTLENNHLVWIDPKFLPLSKMQAVRILCVGLERPRARQWTSLFVTEVSAQGFRFVGETSFYPWVKLPATT